MSLLSKTLSHLRADLSLQDLTLLAQTLVRQEVLGEVPGGGPALVTAHLHHQVCRGGGEAGQEQAGEQHAGSSEK